MYIEEDVNVVNFSKFRPLRSDPFQNDQFKMCSEDSYFEGRQRGGQFGR